MSATDSPDTTAEEPSPEQLARALKSRLRSVQLATIGEQGEPHVGYTPVVFDGKDLLIFVSELALHTRDLLARPTAAVLLIEDEQATSQIFARTRLSYQCRATLVPPDDDDYELLLDLYQARHGKMVTLLRQLPDFRLFRLQPQAGMFVMGFGKAYHLRGDDLELFEHARSA